MSGRVVVPRAADLRVRLPRFDFDLPQKAAGSPCAGVRWLLHWGGDEETELLGVEERYAVRLVFVERQDQRCQVRLPKVECLG